MAFIRGVNGSKILCPEYHNEQKFVVTKIKMGKKLHTYFDEISKTNPESRKLFRTC
jgi:hypothetical protein